MWLRRGRQLVPADQAPQRWRTSRCGGRAAPGCSLAVACMRDDLRWSVGPGEGRGGAPVALCREQGTAAAAAHINPALGIGVRQLIPSSLPDRTGWPGARRALTRPVDERPCVWARSARRPVGARPPVCAAPLGVGLAACKRLTGSGQADGGMHPRLRSCGSAAAARIAAKVVVSRQQPGGGPGRGRTGAAGRRTVPARHP